MNNPEMIPMPREGLSDYVRRCDSARDNAERTGMTIEIYEEKITAWIEKYHGEKFRNVQQEFDYGDRTDTETTEG